MDESSRLFRQIFNPVEREDNISSTEFCDILGTAGIRCMHDERLNATDLRASLLYFYQFNITRKRSIFFHIWKTYRAGEKRLPLYLFIELFKTASAFIVIAFPFNSTMVHWINYKFNWQGKLTKCICINIYYSSYYFVIKSIYTELTKINLIIWNELNKIKICLTNFVPIVDYKKEHIIPFFFI